MSWISILCSVAIASAILAGIATPALAALPPLSEENLQEQADYIVVGTVKSISSQEVRNDWGSNYEYRAIATVETVEKELPGSADTSPSRIPTPRTDIEVRYWQAGKRPLGWAGAGGQYSGLTPNTRVRLFLRVDRDRRLHLLEPNGWESLQPD